MLDRASQNQIVKVERCARNGWRMSRGWSCGFLSISFRVLYLALATCFSATRFSIVGAGTWNMFGATMMMEYNKMLAGCKFGSNWCSIYWKPDECSMSFRSRLMNIGEKKVSQSIKSFTIKKISSHWLSSKSSKVYARIKSSTKLK